METAATCLKETVAGCQARAREATARLAKTFSFVPDDKLRWSPAKTARSALAIIGHTILGNRMFAMVIRGETLPQMPTPEEEDAMSRQFEATIKDRADAVRQLDASCAEVVAALGTMTAERFATSPNSPFGQLPMAFWMSLSGLHAEGHAAQIDYLQTTWGDMTHHM